MSKRVDEFDVELGRKVREFREFRGISQQKLAEHLGVSFQQIQKYETGTNRISAVNLWRIADVFGVPIEDFQPFESTTGVQDSPPLNRRTVRMVKAFHSVNDDTQKNICNFLEKLAKSE